MSYKIVSRSIDSTIEESADKSVLNLKSYINKCNRRDIEEKLNGAFTDETLYISVLDIDTNVSLLSCYTFISDDKFDMFGARLVKNYNNEYVSIFEHLANKLYDVSKDMGYTTLNLYFISRNGKDIKNVICSDNAEIGGIKGLESILHYDEQYEQELFSGYRKVGNIYD